MFLPSKELVSEPTIYPLLTEWRWRTERAIQRGRFTMQDSYFAWHWGRCAVGEARRYYNIPVHQHWRPSQRCPINSQLRSLGVRFNKAVQRDRMSQALRIIGEIEAYVAQTYVPISN